MGAKALVGGTSLPLTAAAVPAAAMAAMGVDSVSLNALVGWKYAWYICRPVNGPEKARSLRCTHQRVWPLSGFGGCWGCGWS